jgi:hypothetical protein
LFFVSLYEQLPSVFLARLFVEINRSIKNGVLSKAMYYEIDLIKAVADKRGLSEIDLRKIYLVDREPLM